MFIVPALTATMLMATTFVVTTNVAEWVPVTIQSSILWK